jgi:hypothetical protein
LDQILINVILVRINPNRIIIRVMEMTLVNPIKNPNSIIIEKKFWVERVLIGTVML